MKINVPICAKRLARRCGVPAEALSREILEWFCLGEGMQIRA